MECPRKFIFKVRLAIIETRVFYNAVILISQLVTQLVLEVAIYGQCIKAFSLLQRIRAVYNFRI